MKYPGQDLSVQQRSTSCFRQRDGRSLHVRQASQPEAHLAPIYEILGLDANPGGTRKFTA